MAQSKRTITLTELLLECMGKPDPMLNVLEWLYNQLMEAENITAVGHSKE